MAGLFYGYCRSSVVNTAGGEAPPVLHPPQWWGESVRPRSPCGGRRAARPTPSTSPSATRWGPCATGFLQAMLLNSSQLLCLCICTCLLSRTAFFCLPSGATEKSILIRSSEVASLVGCLTGTHTQTLPISRPPDK